MAGPAARWRARPPASPPAATRTADQTACHAAPSPLPARKERGGGRGSDEAVKKTRLFGGPTGLRGEGGRGQNETRPQRALTSNVANAAASQQARQTYTQQPLFAPPARSLLTTHPPGGRPSRHPRPAFHPPGPPSAPPPPSPPRTHPPTHLAAAGDVGGPPREHLRQQRQQRRSDCGRAVAQQPHERPREQDGALLVDHAGNLVRGVKERERACVTVVECM